MEQQREGQMKIRPFTISGVAIWAGIVVAALIVRSDQARACGGLFCNTRPPDPLAPLPVAQTGENVVFAIEKDPAGGASTLTAHIQILYSGDAAKFSWVVPVDSVPVVTVGTDRLFTTLASLTQPQFSSTSVIDGQCIPQPFFPGSADAGMRAGTGGSSAGTGGSAGSTAGPGVTVAFMGAVGNYEVSVVQSTDPTDPTGLKVWLTDNGYVISDQASGLIDAYVQQHKYFVAVKLQPGVGVKFIQPIVMTFKANEPCVPLRLTAIAAFPDMQVRLWVFADHRAVPKNFYELKIDDARIDWQSGGSNYNALVSEAANGAPRGNAFVAEYAGTSSLTARTLWFDGQYNLTPLQSAMTPPAYLQALLALGLGNDSQTLPLLARYIPMPDAVKAMGITDSAFYGNLSFYWSQYAFPPYDLAGLTSEVSSKIIEPRHVAQTMMDAHPYLTRLNTFISPEEMNDDALFIVNRDLPEVPLQHTAIFQTMCGNMQFMACNAPVLLALPDGRKVWVRTGSTATTCNFRPYDLTNLQGLPAAEMVWQRQEVGEGDRVVDNSAAITAGLRANNNAFPAEQRMFPIPAQNPTAPGGGPVAQSGSGGCACGIGDPAGASVRAVGIGLGVAMSLGLAAWLLRSGRRRRLVTVSSREKGKS
jgi:hypothetical protein